MTAAACRSCGDELNVEAGAYAIVELRRKARERVEAEDTAFAYAYAYGQLDELLAGVTYVLRGLCIDCGALDARRRGEWVHGPRGLQ